jgi:guanylate kinase
MGCGAIKSRYHASETVQLQNGDPALSLLDSKGIEAPAKENDTVVLVAGAGTEAINGRYIKGKPFTEHSSCTFWKEGTTRSNGLHCTKAHAGCPAGWYFTTAPKDDGVYYNLSADRENPPLSDWAIYKGPSSNPGSEPMPKLSFEVKAESLAKPQAIVFCGPSGAGKSTLFKKLIDGSFSNACFRLALQDTTRKPRPGEKNGKEYWFTDLDTFNADQKEGCYNCLGVLERDEKTKYGFRDSQLIAQAHPNDTTQRRVISILDIDVERAVKLSTKDVLDVMFVIVLTTSASVVRERLMRRGEASEEFLTQRFDYSQKQVELGFQHWQMWDLVMVNEDIEASYDQLLKRVMSRLSLEPPELK